MGSLPRLSLTLSYAVFTVLLMYSSGVPVVVVSVLQQLDLLPPLSSSWWYVFFPLGGGSSFSSSPSSSDSCSVDLTSPSYLTLALPFFLMSLLWESFVIFKVLDVDERPLHVPRFSDTLVSLSAGALSLLITSVLFLMWVEPLYNLIWDNARITDYFNPNDPCGGMGALPFWVCLVFNDFLYYVWHRVSHQISWMWTNHVVHHSTEEYNLSTALRQPFNDFLSPGFFVGTLPLAFLFPWRVAYVHQSLSLLYQYWIHTCLIPPLPRFELLFNSPSLHRIHHARNVRALGKNYGAILSVWDRMFGTFEPEDVVLASPCSSSSRGGSEPLLGGTDKEALFYGVIPPVHSFDPIWLNLHHWHHMLFVQPRWHGALSPFVKWTPSPGGKCPKVGSHIINSTNKFDPPMNGMEGAYVKTYVGLQFAAAMLLSLVLLTFGTSSVGDFSVFDSINGGSGGKTLGASTVSLVAFVYVLWTVHGFSPLLEYNAPHSSYANSSVLLSALLRREQFRVACMVVVIAVFLSSVVSTSGGGGGEDISTSTAAMIGGGAGAYAVGSYAMIWLIQRVSEAGGGKEKGPVYALRNKGWKTWYPRRKPKLTTDEEQMKAMVVSH